MLHQATFLATCLAILLLYVSGLTHLVVLLTTFIENLITENWHDYVNRCFVCANNWHWPVSYITYALGNACENCCNFAAIVASRI